MNRWCMRFWRRSGRIKRGVSARLVAAAGFKPVVGPGDQVPGGFDSHPLPFGGW